MRIEEIRDALTNGVPVEYSIHCQQRMLERNILREDVVYCIYNGEIIEEYPLEKGNKSPKSLTSCLILGAKKTSDDKIHIVVGFNERKIIIISACYPDARWEKDFKTRRNLDV